MSLMSFDETAWICLKPSMSETATSVGEMRTMGPYIAVQVVDVQDAAATRHGTFEHLIGVVTVPRARYVFQRRSEGAEKSLVCQNIVTMRLK